MEKLKFGRERKSESIGEIIRSLELLARHRAEEIIDKGMENVLRRYADFGEWDTIRNFLLINFLRGSLGRIQV